MPAGRPTKMTARVKADVLEHLELGLSLADALKCLDVSHTSYVRAKQDDPDFGRGVKSAAARGKAHHLRRVHGGVPNWQASAWFLERKYGAEYGQKLRLDHGGSVQVVEEIVSGGGAAQAQANGNGHASPGAGRIP